MNMETEGPTREAMCYVSCRNPVSKKCISSYSMTDIDQGENLEFKDLLREINRLLEADYPDRTKREGLDGIQLPAGSPCNNFRGYCDVFHKCRGVDADGPLARLKNLIFNPQTLRSIKDWIEIHWWAVMLMSSGLVIVMAVFIKVCAVHTPSSNPRKSKARKLTMTLRRSHNRQRSGNSQTAALTSNQHRSGRSRGGGGQGQGSSQGSEGSSSEPSRSGQVHKPNSGAVAAASSAAAGSSAGASGSGGGGGGSGGAAAVIVEKFRDPPPPYTSALLPENSKLPPHGKGKRGKRRERGVELQRL